MSATEQLRIPVLQMVSKRPVSPHVFEVDEPTTPHYKMPMNAVSSIMTRGTGCLLSASALHFV